MPYLYLVVHFSNFSLEIKQKELEENMSRDHGDCKKITKNMKTGLEKHLKLVNVRDNHQE
jgi:hypothetical protein